MSYASLRISTFQLKIFIEIFSYVTNTCCNMSLRLSSSYRAFKEPRGLLLQPVQPVNNALS